MKRSRGALSRQTQKLKGRSRPTVTQYTREFAIGSKVVIAPRPIRDGMPPLRYSFRHGTIVERRGESYVVEIRDQNKMKQILSHPVHLERVAASSG